MKRILWWGGYYSTQSCIEGLSVREVEKHCLKGWSCVTIWSQGSREQPVWTIIPLVSSTQTLAAGKHTEAGMRQQLRTQQRAVLLVPSAVWQPCCLLSCCFLKWWQDRSDRNS